MIDSTSFIISSFHSEACFHKMLRDEVDFLFCCFIHPNSFPILLPPVDPRFPPWKKDRAASPSFSQDWRPAIDKKEDWKRKGKEVPPGSGVEQAGKRWLHIQVQIQTNSHKILT